MATRKQKPHHHKLNGGGEHSVHTPYPEDTKQAPILPTQTLLADYSAVCLVGDLEVSNMHTRRVGKVAKISQFHFSSS